MVDLRSHDVDRLFIQALMTRRVVSEVLLKKLFVKSKAAVLSVDKDVQVSDLDWPTFLARVKSSLDVLDLNIARTVDEETGHGVYALVGSSTLLFRLLYSLMHQVDLGSMNTFGTWRQVNTVGDEVSKLATEYPAEHIVYFRHIKLIMKDLSMKVEQIMTAPRQAFSISSMAALSELASLPEPVRKKITKIQAQALLNSFVARGWLAKSQVFALGHNARKCPTCNAPWPNSGALKEVGEGAVKDGDREPRRQIDRSGSQEGEEEADAEGQEEDVDVNDAEGPSQNQNGKKKQRQRKGNRKPTKEGKRSTRKRTPEDEQEDEPETAESQEEEQEEPMTDEDSDGTSKPRRKSRR
ncbi:hypothetical protein FRB96_003115 [Tulasnella sp. 330]|nr:hypothetical protein FRB96_003115 [Tulasnella sp. 330]